MTNEISVELENRVEEFSVAWCAHDAAAIQKEFFAPNACVVGDGMSRAATDQTSVTAAIEYMIGVAPLMKIEIVKTDEYSESFVGSWLNWHVIDARGSVLATMRSLTLWKKIDGRLVILADSYSTGSL